MCEIWILCFDGQCTVLHIKTITFMIISFNASNNDKYLLYQQ